MTAPSEWRILNASPSLTKGEDSVHVVLDRKLKGGRLDELLLTPRAAMELAEKLLHAALIQTKAGP